MKLFLRPAQDRLHAAAVGFDARRFGVVESAPMHGAPEIGVELEVRAAPIGPHRAEQIFEVRLSLGVGSVERIPRAAPPSAEGDLVRRERLAVGAFHEPVGMLLKQVGTRLGDERRHPDRGLEAAPPDLFEHALHVAAKGFAGRS